MAFLDGGELSCHPGVFNVLSSLLDSKVSRFPHQTLLKFHELFWTGRFQVAPHHTPSTHEDMPFCSFGNGETGVQKGKVMCLGCSKRGHDTTKSEEAQVCAWGPGMIGRNGGHMEPQ